MTTTEKPWGIPEGLTIGEAMRYPYYVRRDIAPDHFETKPPYAASRPRVAPRGRTHG